MKEIILRSCHDKELAGTTLSIEEGTERLIFPLICGCTAEFVPAGYKEGDKEVWRQSGFKFKEYRDD